MSHQDCQEDEISVSNFSVRRTPPPPGFSSSDCGKFAPWTGHENMNSDEELVKLEPMDKLPTSDKPYVIPAKRDEGDSSVFKSGDALPSYPNRHAADAEKSTRGQTAFEDLLRSVTRRCLIPPYVPMQPQTIYTLPERLVSSSFRSHRYGFQTITDKFLTGIYGFKWPSVIMRQLIFRSEGKRNKDVIPGLGVVAKSGRNLNFTYMTPDVQRREFGTLISPGGTLRMPGCEMIDHHVDDCDWSNSPHLTTPHRASGSFTRTPEVLAAEQQDANDKSSLLNVRADIFTPSSTVSPIEPGKWRPRPPMPKVERLDLERQAWHARKPDASSLPLSVISERSEPSSQQTLAAVPGPVSQVESAKSVGSCGTSSVEQFGDSAMRHPATTGIQIEVRAQIAFIEENRGNPNHQDLERSYFWCQMLSQLLHIQDSWQTAGHEFVKLMLSHISDQFLQAWNELPGIRVSAGDCRNHNELDADQCYSKVLHVLWQDIRNLSNHRPPQSFDDVSRRRYQHLFGLKLTLVIEYARQARGGHATDLPHSTANIVIPDFPSFARDAWEQVAAIEKDFNERSTTGHHSGASGAEVAENSSPQNVVDFSSPEYAREWPDVKAT